MNCYRLPPPPQTEFTPPVGFNTALIIEMREHAALHFVLCNFTEHLPAEKWGFVLLHGTGNAAYVEGVLSKMPAIHRARIRCINIGVDNLTRMEYSDLFFNPGFYRYIPTEMFLVFQTDTMILPENQDKINEYMEYDYVGAPWPSYNTPVAFENGNGGLSLRRKSKMLELLTYADSPALKGKMEMGGNCYIEDVFFSGIYQQREHRVKMKKATYHVACDFSVEAAYEGGEPFGVHSVWKYGDVYCRLIVKYPYLKNLAVFFCGHNI